MILDEKIRQLETIIDALTKRVEILEETITMNKLNESTYYADKEGDNEVIDIKLNEIVESDYYELLFTKMEISFDVEPYLANRRDNYYVFSGKQGKHFIVLRGLIINTSNYTYNLEWSAASLCVNQNKWFPCEIMYDPGASIGTKSVMIRPENKKHFVIVASLPDMLIKNIKTVEFCWGEAFEEAAPIDNTDDAYVLYRLILERQ